MKVPDDTHRISITPTAERVVVRVGGRVVADSLRALTLTETSYPPRQYIPAEDVDLSALTRTLTSTYCPYKGEAGYFGVEDGSGTTDVAWVYEHAYDAVAAIEGHLAFDPARAEITLG